jgi:hypothetical protein
MFKRFASEKRILSSFSNFIKKKVDDYPIRCDVKEFKHETNTNKVVSYSFVGTDNYEERDRKLTLSTIEYLIFDETISRHGLRLNCFFDVLSDYSFTLDIFKYLLLRNDHQKYRRFYYLIEIPE